MSRRLSSLRSKKLQSKKLKIRAYKYSLLAVVIVIFISGLVTLTRAHFLQADNVVVNGNKIVDSSAIEGIVKDQLASSYFWFLPKSNIALFPRKDTEAKILQQSSAIAAVSVHSSGLKTIDVDVKEYVPAYLWCTSEARDKCYFMDNRGYIFSESAGFSNGVLFTYYGLIDTSGSKSPIGQTFLPEAKFIELNHFVDSMKLLKLSPVGLNARGEDDFELYTSSGGSVLFSNREVFLTTFENLETTIEAQTRLDKDFLLKLDYIDVRFSSKVFVKLKEPQK